MTARVPEVTVVLTGLAHPEGPALCDDGSLVFVETYRERVTRWLPGRPAWSHADTGGGPNACAVGHDGVYLTQIGAGVGPWRAFRPRRPSIQRIAWDGRVTDVVTTVAGAALRAPNDLCFGVRGNLVFTDPGDFDPDAPQDGYVYSVRPDGRCDFVVETGPAFPNGVVALPDDSIVWVESYTRRVRRRAADGTVRDVATLASGHIPDGLAAAVTGELFVASIGSGGVDVVRLDGGEAAFLRTGGQPLNCAFAGEDLYITDAGTAGDGVPEWVEARGRLLRVGARTRGAGPYRGEIRGAPCGGD